MQVYKSQIWSCVHVLYLLIIISSSCSNVTDVFCRFRVDLCRLVKLQASFIRACAGD